MMIVTSLTYGFSRSVVLMLITEAAEKVKEQYLQRLTIL
jgi:hypothetical protein